MYIYIALQNFKNVFFFFPDTAFPEQVMMTLSPEEKEQFLSLKKGLKDLSKGSWLYGLCNRLLTTDKLPQQVCGKRMPDALAQRLGPRTCCWKDLITHFENGLSQKKLDENLDI